MASPNPEPEPFDLARVGRDELTELVDDLRRLARRYLAGERAGHTLQPTALVNEVFLRLCRSEHLEPPPTEEEVRGSWNPKRLYVVAAVAMRRILINHARDRRRLKRGGDRLRIEVAADDARHPAVAGATTMARQLDVLALDEALVELAELDARKARLVELRYFVGLSLEAAADAIDVSLATAKRDWAFARAWLARRIEGHDR